MNGLFSSPSLRTTFQFQENMLYNELLKDFKAEKSVVLFIQKCLSTSSAGHTARNEYARSQVEI
jgi:hypothetical protein